MTSLVAFSKVSTVDAADDLRVNPAAVLYVEASRPDLLGHTTVHLLGQGTAVNAFDETIGTVVASLGGLVAARRHYLAAPPLEGASTVYVSPRNVSYARPNVAVSPDFWVLRFVDGSELNIANPLPSGL